MNTPVPLPAKSRPSTHSGQSLGLWPRRTRLVTLTLPRTLKCIWKRTRRELRAELSSYSLLSLSADDPSRLGSGEPSSQQSSPAEAPRAAGSYHVSFQGTEKLKDNAPCVFTHCLITRTTHCPSHSDVQASPHRTVCALHVSSASLTEVYRRT